MIEEHEDHMSAGLRSGKLSAAGKRAGGAWEGAQCTARRMPAGSGWQGAMQPPRSRTPPPAGAAEFLCVQAAGVCSPAQARASAAPAAAEAKTEL